MNTNYITNIVGSRRYKKAKDQNTNIQLNLEEKVRPVIEDNVIDIVNQYQVFLDEREKSKKYRINGKFNLYTTNVVSTGASVYISGKYTDSSWSPIFYGIPQPVAPSNWVMQITYPSDSIYDYLINARTPTGPIISEAYRGLQYESLGTTLINNNNYLTITGVQNHNLTEDDYVYIYGYVSNNQLQGVYRVKNLGINGKKTKKDLTLDVVVDPTAIPAGTGNFYKIFGPSTEDIQFQDPNDILFATATDISGNTTGTYSFNEPRYAKITSVQKHNLVVNNFVDLRIGAASTLNGVWRVYNILGPYEFIIRVDLYVNKGTVITPGPTSKYRPFKGTPSEYYVRMFEVLTTNDYEVYPCSYASNIYPDVIDYKLGVANDTWLFHYNEDIDLKRLKTNRNAEVSNLFYTVVKRAGKNPFGWSHVTADWDFNYETADTSNGIEFISTFNPSGIGSIEKLSGRTEYIDSNGEIVAVPGSKYVGDFVEFNDKEILEKSVSDIIHRFGTAANANGQGYYHKPFNKLEIRKYSNVIETAESAESVLNIPNEYVTYDDNTVAWRDLLTVGYFEEGTNGVDYPFVNNAHYYYFNYNLYIKLQPGPLSMKLTARDGFINPNNLNQEC